MKNLNSDKDNFYISEDYPTEYMYCYQLAKWNVEKISKNNNANGYIVQMLKRKIEIDNNINAKKYFEAWKVENGQCYKFDNFGYDDIFLVGHDTWDSFYELKMSIGKSGQSCFEGIVFWIDKSDELYKNVDKWNIFGVQDAKELKSIKYSKKLEEQFINRNFFKREPFIHKWSMKKEDDIFRVACKYLYTQCDGYDNKMKKAKLDNYVEDLFSEGYYNIKQKVIEEMKKQLQIDDI